MCTLTFVARRKGYALGMNRDEKRARAAALPPSIQHIAGGKALLPSEPGGGTWIGANDFGATFALLNWYSVAKTVNGAAISRGQIVRAVLGATSQPSAQRILDANSLGRVNPFRLVGIFPDRTIVEWRWDLSRLETKPHEWKGATWISSGYDEPGAEMSRRQNFATALDQLSAGTLPWLRRLHRCHQPTAGPYSTCMHRAEAVTVSYTEVMVTGAAATVRYTPGAPCCNRKSFVERLSLRQAPLVRNQSWERQPIFATSRTKPSTPTPSSQSLPSIAISNPFERIVPIAIHTTKARNNFIGPHHTCGRT
jgi:hypothetical protein